MSVMSLSKRVADKLVKSALLALERWRALNAHPHLMIFSPQHATNVEVDRRVNRKDVIERTLRVVKPPLSLSMGKSGQRYSQAVTLPAGVEAVRSISDVMRTLMRVNLGCDKGIARGVTRSMYVEHRLECHLDIEGDSKAFA